MRLPGPGTEAGKAPRMAGNALVAVCWRCRVGIEASIAQVLPHTQPHCHQKQLMPDTRTTTSCADRWRTHGAGDGRGALVATARQQAGCARLVKPGRRRGGRPQRSSGPRPRQRQQAASWGTGA